MRLRAAILLVAHELSRAAPPRELEPLARTLLQANLLVRIRLTSQQSAEAALLAGRLQRMLDP